MGNIRSFKDLRIWQKGIEIVKDVYLLTKGFPREETYGLTAQARRSAVSIPSNIAEGFKRGHRKEQEQFLRIALGSVAELETQFIIATELGFVPYENAQNLFRNLTEESKMITCLLSRFSVLGTMS